MYDGVFFRFFLRRGFVDRCLELELGEKREREGGGGFIIDETRGVCECECAGSVCVRRWNKEGLVDLQSGSGRKCQERRRSSRKRPCGAIQVTNVATPIKPPATEVKPPTYKALSSFDKEFVLF
jgi:hypothetical protein